MLRDRKSGNNECLESGSVDGNNIDLIFYHAFHAHFLSMHNRLEKIPYRDMYNRCLVSILSVIISHS